MSAVKAIYQAPKEFEIRQEEDYSIVLATIFYNGQSYEGIASLHPEDADFFSEKVGKTIALSRARQEALTYAIYEAQTIAEIKYRLYQEVIAYGSKSPAEVDPTGAFLMNVSHALNRVDFLKKALVSEQDSLVAYLKDHKSALDTVKAMRARKVKDN